MKVITVQSPKERQDAYEVRKRVFVEEQHVPLELEIDEHEEEAAHFVLYDEGKPCGAGRFRTKDGLGKAERICILPDYRKKGAGRLIMEALETHAKGQGLPGVKLDAQVHAIPFYEKLGYEIISDEFMDAGIPHKTMKKTF
ncbi:GNAT family N-acetyltransferase [Bacillus thermotolerans]|uniref:GNAT family acetyltransferase YjcF n=1 Tax=Bacillus thermotolerans TaxID=1221996 RepID=A0A0F5HZ27_BACTR|nr:GNAT family N-acetyltransferase [Bacillus thermotolerans]KKB38087.1 GNAT family acetyltransferase YjcF [Bacillus thermotolerans]KKB40749.1 GNAT family acetyltransferase YjcF [Bacillus thermotolerans]KKB41663.1 GNAT family acetyltransferase YjcF [Bacillus thermotolerans]